MRRSSPCRSTRRPTATTSASRRLIGETGYTTLERRGTRPTLDVNGMWSGFTGHGAKTIIPAHAHAEASCRLVAAEDPDVIFERFRDHVLAIASPGVTTTVDLHRGRHAESDADRPSRDAGRRAGAGGHVRRGAGVQPRRRQASPYAPPSDRSSGCPSSCWASCRPTRNAHAPNEWMLLRNYELGIRAVIRTFDELGLAATLKATPGLSRAAVAVWIWWVRVGVFVLLSGASLCATAPPGR